MEKIIVNNKKIENMIYEVRGKQVMIDSDLAKLYQCKNGTKSVNLAVKRNIDKFPERYCFQLNINEYNSLKFQFETSNQNEHGGVRKLPYVFTEEGVAMLATVLRTPIATKISIAIMDAFVAMRHYLLENKDIYLSLSNINNKLDRHEQKFIEYDNMFDELFDKFNNNELKEKIFFDGSMYDAYSKIVDIFNKAQKELIIIDNYADKKVLDMISNLKVKVSLIIKNNKLLKKIDIEKYKKQYDNLEIIYSNNFHDRFLIIDKKEVYHLGSSINYAGKKIFAINKLEEEIMINNFIEIVKNIIKKHVS